MDFHGQIVVSHHSHDHSECLEIKVTLSRALSKKLKFLLDNFLTFSTKTLRAYLAWHSLHERKLNFRAKSLTYVRLSELGGLFSAAKFSDEEKGILLSFKRSWNHRQKSGYRFCESMKITMDSEARFECATMIMDEKPRMSPCGHFGEAGGRKKDGFLKFINLLLFKLLELSKCFRRRAFCC